MERFTSRDLRLLALCAAIAAASLFVGVRYYFQAFPEAAIDFRYTLESSSEPALAFLRAAGLDPAGYRHAAIFGYDDQAKTFLERELPADRRNALLDSTVRLWRWQHRWFRPLEKEEINVAVTTRGEVVGLRHELPEDAPGAAPAESQARAAAEAFLTGPMGRPLAELAFVEGSSQQRPQRTDHVFVWKKAGFDVSGATYRYEVTLAGGKPSGYREFLNLPDAWVRDYEALRSKNDLAALVAAVLLIATMGILLGFLAQRIPRGDVKWKTSSVFGGITAVLLTASQLNSLPASLYDYDTLQSFAGFLALAILQAFAAGAAGGLYVFLLTATGEPFYRERYGRFLSLSALVRPRAFGTREFFLANVVGLTLTCFFFAYENVFYMIANALGAWSPREVPYSDLLSTAFPWMYVLFFGWFPAVSEEFLSRMASIPLVERFTKSTAFAVVLSAFVWGFAHSNYPNQPFYIRGLEVGLAGVVFGLVFLRFGIVAVVVCHFSVDALYSAFALMRSPSLYQQVSGAAAAGVFVLVLVATLAGYLRRGGFLPGHPTNADEGTAAAPPEAPPAPAVVAPVVVQPLPRAVRLGGLAVAALFAALWFVPVERFGDWVEIRNDRAAARAAASRFLTEQGFDVGGTKSSVVAGDSLDTDQGQYLLSAGGLPVAQRFYRDLVPTPSWMVRFFTPGKHEEWRVRVDTASDRIVGFVRVLPDDAEGAALAPDEAAKVAERFLAQRGEDVSKGELKEQSAKQEKARTDHMLVWEFPEAGAGEARLRLEVDVQGNQVGRYKRAVKVPEAWERQRGEVTIAAVLFRWLKAPVIVVLIGFAVVLLIANIRKREMAWKSGAAAAAVATAAWLAHSTLVFDRFWEAYQTSMPASIFLAVSLVATVIFAGLTFGGTLLGVALAGGLYRGASNPLRLAVRGVAGLDAAAAGIVAFGLLVGCSAMEEVIAAAIPGGRLLRGLVPPTSFESSLPALDVLLVAVLAAILLAVCGAIGAAVLVRYVKPAWARAVLALLLIVGFVPAFAFTAAERLAGSVIVATWVAALLLFAALYLRSNPLAWLVAPFTAVALWNGVRLATSPNDWYRGNGVVVLVVVAAVLIWLAAGTRKQSSPAAAT